MEPLTVTVQEAARISGLSHVTIYKFMKEGRVRWTKVGRKTLVSYLSLKELLDPTHDLTHKSGLNSGVRTFTPLKIKRLKYRRKLNRLSESPP